jgi:hypothetical protein
MAGLNPVTTYNPALLQQQQQAVQPQPTTTGGEGMSDLQQALAGANALTVEGTTTIVPQIQALAQQSAQVAAANKQNDQLRQQNLALQAQIQANALKGQQQGVQGQALQQLQTTMSTLPQVQTGMPNTTTTAITPQQPNLQQSVVSNMGGAATTGLSDRQSEAIRSGDLGTFAQTTAETALSGWQDVQKALDDSKQRQTYRNALMAQGISKEQATAMANQQIPSGTSGGAVATGQNVVVPPQQQPVAQPQQQVVVQPQPVVQQTIEQSQPQPVVQPQYQPQAIPTTPIEEEMVNVAGVGLVSKATLTAVLQNTSPEAQERAQQELAAQQAQQQQQQAVAPRAVLSTAENTVVQQPTTQTEISPEEAAFAKAKMEAAKLGFDTTTMPSTYAEFRAKQRQRHKNAMAQMLKKPKLYVPKPDDSKYAAYGGGE